MIVPGELLWLALVGLPTASALGCVVLSPRLAERIARAASLATLAVALLLLVGPARGSAGGILGWDALSDLFAVLVAALYALSTWESSLYLASVRASALSPSNYYALLGGFAAAMLATLSVSDLALMWIGLETTTVVSALLVMYDRRPASVEAAWRYTLIASGGLAVGLFALALLYRETGSLDAFALAAHPPALTAALALVVALALIGFGTKVGLFPMHAWLPDTHSEAPAPVSALLSGVLLPTALYVFLRIYDLLPSTGALGLHELVVAVGALTALVAAFLTFGQRSYKRLFAYSSMENMGIALVGIGLGGIALYGALLLLVAHAFAKSSAFSCAGAALRTTGTSRIDAVRGLGRRRPRTGVLWILSGLAVTGAPPFGSFVAEFVILTGALAQGAYAAVAALIVALAVAFAGINYPLGRMVFSRADPPDRPADVPEGWLSTVVPGIALGVALAVGLGSIPYLTGAVRIAAGGGFP